MGEKGGDKDGGTHVERTSVHCASVSKHGQAWASMGKQGQAGASEGKQGCGG